MITNIVTEERQGNNETTLKQQFQFDTENDVIWHQKGYKG